MTSYVQYQYLDTVAVVVGCVRWDTGRSMIEIVKEPEWLPTTYVDHRFTTHPLTETTPSVSAHAPCFPFFVIPRRSLVLCKQSCLGFPPACYLQSDCRKHTLGVRQGTLENVGWHWSMIEDVKEPERLPTTYVDHIYHTSTDWDHIHRTAYGKVFRCISFTLNFASFFR